MATASALLPIEIYLDTPYKPEVDFVEGILEERNVGERDHAQVQWLIAEMLGPARKRLRILGLIEQRIRVSATRVRICDVVLLAQESPYEKVTTAPPLVCIEILSPEDRLPRAELVLADYYAMGVRNIWLIDPMRRCAYTFDGSALHPRLDGELIVPGTDIKLNLDTLFSEMDSELH